MANFQPYFPKILASEGEVYENDPTDNGGCTKYGIILSDLIEFHIDKNQDNKYTCNDVKLLTKDDAHTMYKKMYWDYFKADSINNQSLAEYIVDGAINQGKGLIAKYIQNILGLKEDGIVGTATLSAINLYNAENLYDKLKQKRIDRYNHIVQANPSQVKFLHGWINRANCIDYSA
jgi:lysozyme family protein